MLGALSYAKADAKHTISYLVISKDSGATDATHGVDGDDSIQVAEGCDLQSAHGADAVACHVMLTGDVADALRPFANPLVPYLSRM